MADSTHGSALVADIKFTIHEYLMAFDQEK